jgi:ribosomal protein S21
MYRLVGHLFLNNCMTEMTNGEQSLKEAHVHHALQGPQKKKKRNKSKKKKKNQRRCTI